MKIFSNLAADGGAIMALKQGVAPHEVVFPATIPSSVLSTPQFDPALIEADIAFGQPEAEAVLRTPRLRWLEVSSAGYTRYDTPDFRKAAAERKLIVTNSSAVYAAPCAEHVLAFMLAHARRLPEGLRAGGSGDFTPWLHLRKTSTLLRGQRVLILGFGSIARHLVELLRPFGMEIAALRRKPEGNEGVRVITADALNDALSNADHMIDLLPANAGSEHFMSAARFGAMKKGAVFYNVGRGATVDQDALLAALQSGRLAAAWLDVTEPEPLPSGHPLLSTPGCYITPHIAGGHSNESEMLVRHFLENFRRFLNGTPLLDQIF
jgi:phosphoglycerate dehydrogenase-like enzyme